MSENQVGSKMIWTTNLRVVATFSVIFLHVTSEILYQFGRVSDFVWWTGNIYDSMVRFCVPVFVMLTGALMLGKTYELNDFLKKRFSRIVFPFLFWSFIYAILALRHKISEDHGMSFLESIKWIIHLLQKGSSYHLWYIYMIIGIYLFIPIISKWIQNATEKEILYFLSIWVFTLTINQPILSGFKINIDLTYFSGFIGYVVLGYYLSIKSFGFTRKSIYLIALFLIIIGISITAFGTYFLSQKTNSFNGYFYNYDTLNVLIVSIGVFLFFKNFEIFNPALNKVVNFISKYSYGIYLVHILTLTVIKEIGIHNYVTNPIFAVPVIALLCLFISAVVIYSINKIPYGKYISG
ncbi:acyltransferase [Flavobacterium chilense]|uniref:Surface polysaccharide O-acyltransferase, integral membrane enzyme n=1 Tax=Flavobacterium chilense TaxID=946677 RepID=A0A1M7KJW0_9FLAO|nr:acyltransferase family protein [Flavobacterium chilense]SHM65666.1 Surface polysaccharide O-acyltransferase, integral membrane enzyme [Flavobacterium chilense]